MHILQWSTDEARFLDSMDSKDFVGISELRAWNLILKVENSYCS